MRIHVAFKVQKYNIKMTLKTSRHVKTRGKIRKCARPDSNPAENTEPIPKIFFLVETLVIFNTTKRLAFSEY
jgi:hypothetical protein